MARGRSYGVSPSDRNNCWAAVLLLLFIGIYNAWNAVMYHVRYLRLSEGKRRRGHIDAPVAPLGRIDQVGDAQRFGSVLVD
jgi:hypothetical protein